MVNRSSEPVAAKTKGPHILRNYTRHRRNTSAKMVLMREVKAWVAFLAMLTASTASIPVAGSGGISMKQPLESREDMMIRYRLPNNTIPRLYTITIEPNMDHENLTWIGETSIVIEVLRATPVLTLHAYKNLVIDENFTKLVDANGTIFKPIEQSRNAEVEFLRVRFDREISVGNYSIELKYTGEDAGGYVGFYKASFNSPDMSAIAGTHFEATTARRAFPCWDEPSFKALFRMSIKHYPNYTAVSNMPEIERVPTTNGKILTTFETTPLMPTYLLTFVIADYKNVSNEHGNVTVWGRKELLENFRHVLELSSKIVEVMENYTGFSYGCPRIGSVTLPIYSASATEHWGLVTYSEYVLRLNRTSDGYLRKASADSLIAHELAHSWFGNRVSPVWWDDLWLNEAFAVYFQYYIMDEIFDNWGGAELFVVQTHATSLQGDNEESLPIRWTPITNTEIRLLFGAVTYRKGASIVHMFRNVLTDDVFRAGIKKYLAKHSFGSATAEDLMRAFQEAHDEGVNGNTPLSVRETMTSWLVQTGHPTLNIIRNYTTGVTRVVQEGAFTDVGDGTLIKSTSKWWIPLTYATQSDLNFSSTVPTSWMSDKEDSVTIDGIGKDDWVIFNVRFSGFYRVKYDEENMKRIADYLNTDNYKNIHVLNRAQLIADAGYLVDLSLDRHIGDFYRLTKYLSREVEYPPWRAAKNVIRKFDEALSGTEVHEIFQRYILGLMNALIEKVGFEERDDDDHLTMYARVELVGWACVSGHYGCSEFAAEKLLKVAENRSSDSLQLETKYAIFCAGLRGLNGTKAKQVVEWALANDEGLLLRNLGCTEDHEIHRDFLLDIMKRNLTNAVRIALDYITMGSEENFNFAVAFIIQNHEAMKNLTVEGLTGFADNLLSTIQTIVPQVKSASRLEKFKKILQLDAVFGDNRIDEKPLLETVERIAVRGDEVAAKFRNLWDKHVSADNAVNGEHPESR